jgi:membrane associated rhomboid family serine protease
MNKNEIEHFCFDYSDEHRQLHTWLSYIFVHASYSHLLDNVTAAIQLGYPTYRKLGPLGLNFVFLLGGIVAVIPSDLHLQQTQSFAREMKAFLSSEGERYVPNILKNPWDWMSSGVTHLLTRNLPTKSCGSSGAVCALMGSSLVVTLNELIEFSQRVFIQTNQNSSVTSSLSTTRYCGSRSWAQWWDTVLSYGRNLLFELKIESRSLGNVFELFQKLQFVVSTVSYLLGERTFVYGLQPISRIYHETGTNQFLSILQNSRIGHAAHLQGAIFGICFGLVVPNFQRWMKKHSITRRY